MTRNNKIGGIILGLVLMSFAVVPFICAGDVVCKPRRAVDEYPVWFMAMMVAPFVFSGIVLATHALGMRLVSVTAGVGVPASFAFLIHAYLFIGGANSCDPGSVALRLAVNHEWLPAACRLWPTVIGTAFDSLFLGLALESFRRSALTSPWKDRIEPLVKWLVLVPLAPLLLLFVPVFMLIAGREMVTALWKKIRS